MQSGPGKAIRSIRPRLAYVAVAFAVAILVLVVWTVIEAAPPSSVAMATGPEGSDYRELGLRYQEILARDGVTLRLVPSQGGVENLERLRDSKSGVAVGFAQGGLTNAKESPELVSLGTLFYEPVWVFFRGDLPKPGTDTLKGRSVSVGPPGNGSRKLALDLIDVVGMDRKGMELFEFTPRQAAEALLQGKLDFAIIVNSWESPLAQQLLASGRVNAATIPRAAAHVALRPFLNRLVLPQGVADLKNNRPATDLVLVAPKASLVVRRELHPAIQYLLLQAAEEVHGGPSIFNKAGEFPAAEAIDLPISDDARQYYRTGPPFLQRYLPFWMAGGATKLLILLIPIVGVLYPLLQLLPAAYAGMMRQRIYSLYGELKFLESDFDARKPERGMEDFIDRLDRLRDRADHMQVPTAFASLLYTLRDHITIVRARFEAQPLAVRSDKPAGPLRP
jgi:TRAP-type uncharacterized transport system substrate-binding protein